MASGVTAEKSAQEITFTVNRVERNLRVDPCRRLLDVLREELGLCGTKEGCGLGECGACTVLMDGLPVNACLVLMGSARGAGIVTVEGLGGARDSLHPVQQAFVERGAVQCGFCTPGFILAAASFVDSREGAGDDEIRASLAGNLCRCTGYIKVVEAVQRAFELKKIAAADGERS